MHIAQTDVLDYSNRCENEANAINKLCQVEKDLHDELDSAHVALQIEKNDAVSQRAHFEVAVTAEKARTTRAEEHAPQLLS